MPEPGQHQHRVRWDNTEGRRVRAVEAGCNISPAPTVVIVPGLGALGYLLDTVTCIGRWARVCLVDVPGFGYCGPRPSPAEVAPLAAVVSSWLRRVPEVPVVLVGHSTGAQVAMRAAAAAPECVHVLVLAGPTFPPAQRRLSGLMLSYLRNSRHESLGVIRVNLPDYLRGGVCEVVRYVRSAQRDRPEQVIRDVRCPVLLVRGEHDALAPQRWVNELVEAATNARSITIPGAHAFPYQHERLTADLVADASRSAHPR